jgi:PIN domain nuclease of toxin-antitoxin system
MDILLDTCAFVWAVLEPSRLSAPAVAVLQAKDTAIHVSPLSSAEIACAVERGRLQLTEHWKPWFRRYVDANGWVCLPIDLDVIEEAYSLPPPFHDDPVDRMLVAVARLNHFPIVTADRRILGYPHVKTIW